MEMNFCRRCGKPLKHKQHHIYQCGSGHTLYANQSPAAGVFFVSPDNQRVLLITRDINPGKGMLGIPGGFLDAEESAETAVTREIREEVGLESNDYGPLRYITSQHDTYLYGNELLPVVTFLFWARLNDDRKLKIADEVEGARWYSFEEIDFQQIHAHDVRTGLRELQKLLRSTDV